MKSVILWSLVVLISVSATGQVSEAKQNRRHKNIYFDALGPSLLFGASYDMRLKKGRMDGPGIRLGTGYFAGGFLLSVYSIQSFPIEYNYVFGKRRSSLVFGVGLLPTYTTSETFLLFSFESTKTTNFTLAAGYVTMGYRFQPLRNGITFQFSMNSFAVPDGNIPPIWPGFSLGYGFK